MFTYFRHHVTSPLLSAEEQTRLAAQLYTVLLFLLLITLLWLSEAIRYGFIALLLAVAMRAFSQAVTDAGRRAEARLTSNQALQASEAFAQAILDSVTPHIAVLDKTGVIIAVNQAWSQYVQANGGSPPHTGVGANYLAVCRQATGRDTDYALATAAGIEAVLTGAQPSFTLEPTS
jgi:hypothetical protein